MKEDKQLYTWEQVKAYSIISLHNLLYSANDITLGNLRVCIEPLKILFTPDEAVRITEMLINNEETK